MKAATAKLPTRLRMKRSLYYATNINCDSFRVMPKRKSAEKYSELADVLKQEDKV